MEYLQNKEMDVISVTDIDLKRKENSKSSKKLEKPLKMLKKPNCKIDPRTLMTGQVVKGICRSATS